MLYPGFINLPRSVVRWQTGFAARITRTLSHQDLIELTRHLAIGDIHGCYTALQSLLQSINVRDDDVLITLGDYINRGPSTAAVLDYLIDTYSKGRLHPLRGNHEIIMLNARHDELELKKWLEVGGRETLLSYAPLGGDAGKLTDIPDAHWQFVESNLLPYYETDTHFFVHASAYPDVALSDQPDFMLYWERYNDPPKHESGKIMVCGHTSQKSGIPITNGNAICIDTWAFGSGWLTCLDIDSGKLWQSNEKGETRQMWLDEL